MDWCIAPTLSYALVFSLFNSDPTPGSWASNVAICYSDHHDCETAASAAKLAGARITVKCEEQPAGDPLRPRDTIGTQDRSE